MAENLKWTGWHTIGLFLIIIAIALVNWLLTTESMLWTWLITLILLFIFCAVAGQGTTGLWRGLLIDERNKMSLSRLQLLLWTVIVLSAYLTAALANIVNNVSEPLSITIPEELWLAMGISTVSLVGSPLIKSTKVPKKSNINEKKDTISLLSKDEGIAQKKIDVKGQIIVKKSPSDARWSDLFKGEETGNAALLDLAKIQMFFFTLILVVAYASQLGNIFNNTFKFSELPSISSSMAALLALSHGGYLVNKAVPHSKTG